MIIWGSLQFQQCMWMTEWQKQYLIDCIIAVQAQVNWVASRPSFENSQKFLASSQIQIIKGTLNIWNAHAAIDLKEYENCKQKTFYDSLVLSHRCYRHTNVHWHIDHILSKCSYCIATLLRLLLEVILYSFHKIQCRWFLYACIVITLGSVKLLSAVFLTDCISSKYYKKSWFMLENKHANRKKAFYDALSIVTGIKIYQAKIPQIPLGASLFQSVELIK